MFRLVTRNTRTRIPGWIVVGAGLMYLFDPEQGRRRRALARDRFVHLARVGKQGARRAAIDLSNRAHGARVRFRAKVEPEESVDDEILAERVRSKMGVFVSHPHAVEVTVADGVVTLSGPILQREAQAFTRKVKRMAGVRELVDQLSRHESADGISALQGGVKRGRRPELLQQHWAPGVRLVAVGTGSALLTYGISKRHHAVAALGAAVLLRALANEPFGNMIRKVPSRMIATGSAGGEQPALPEPVEGSRTVPEATPSEEAQEVLRSIRT